MTIRKQNYSVFLFKKNNQTVKQKTNIFKSKLKLRKSKEVAPRYFK